MNRFIDRIGRTRAITMWDFSWLERRWPGAGYADIHRVLDELVERGYDAVRIDAYPHLVSADPHREWELPPCWNQQDWGSPALNRVRIQPHLDAFIAACGERDIAVALSTWYREDRTQRRVHILTPEQHADQWVATLRAIDPSLHKHILYVDLCNEWPLDCWAPFFKPTRDHNMDNWASPASRAWLGRAIDRFRTAFPSMPVTFSTCTASERYAEGPVPAVDLLEPHLWMANASDFYARTGYNYERFSSAGYENLVARAEPLYRADPAHWQAILRERIDYFARCARTQNLPLVTTECWAIVDYKDWPLLDWGWVKELTAVGVEHAVSTGAWAAIATSNFCGPQFRGMWDDIAWHQRLTRLIRAQPLPTLAAPQA